MEKALAAIQDWPVLLQGAVGSALFWLILILGQKITEWASERWSHQSRQAKYWKLVNRYLRLRGRQAGWDLDSAASVATLIMFVAFRPLMKAFMWLSLGLMFQSVAGVLGVIGFIGALYYLFFAYDGLGRAGGRSDLHTGIDEMEKMIAELERPPKKAQ
jgi:hypothetical protein